MTRSICCAASLLVLMACIVLIAVQPLTAAAAAPRLQVFFASDFTDREYQKESYSKVAALWTMPAKMPPEGSKAVVVVVILRDGKGADVRLHFQSGSQDWDDAAVAAVKSAAPFDPLPPGYGPDSVEVHFHFVYSE